MADPFDGLMGSLRVAYDRHRQTTALAEAATRTAAALWEQVDPENIAASWAELEPRVFASTSVAQTAAAKSGEPYVAKAWATLEGTDPQAQGRLVARSLAGVSSDGRSLATLLREPAIRALTAVGQGAATQDAMFAGLASLTRIVGTQVADAGRAGESVSITARTAIDGYVRMLVPPSCSRCAILAGKFYRWNAGFDRHPMCDCRHVPSSEGRADDLTTSPRAYFDSLNAAEQAKYFTESGAQAIRDGADINQVVNVRRKGLVDRATGTTQEGVRRTYAQRKGELPGDERRKIGRAGARMQDTGTTGPRLMPEHIYDIATSRAEAIDLLGKYGYIL